MKFKEIALADLVESYVDNRGKTCPVVEEKESFLPLIATNCITDSLYPEFIKVRFVNKTTYDNWFRSHPQPNDIIFVNKGTPGRTALVPEKVNFCIAQDMVALKIKAEYDFKYVFAALRSEVVKNRIEAMHVGTMIPHFKKGDFKRLTIPVPENKKDQEKIGKVHLDILKKIDNNKRIISNLEQLVQTIFKRWFVDFNFPNTNEEPYKSSSGEMVDSKIGMVPKGWGVGSLKDIAKNISRNIDVNNIPNVTPYIGLEHMPRGSIALSAWETSEKVTSSKACFAEGDILFGKLRPYFKKVGIAPIDGICSTDIIVLNSIEQEQFSYLIGLITQDKFIEYCNATSTGTRMPRTSWKLMQKYEIVIPPREVYSRFHQEIINIFELIKHYIYENRSLINLKNTLLPKLLSGEIKIESEEQLHVQV